MEPDKECFAIGKVHSRAWYAAGLSDARRDEHDGHGTIEISMSSLRFTMVVKRNGKQHRQVNQ